MKTNIIIISAFFAFTAGLMSCQEVEVMSYEGEEGVYFAVQYGAEWGDTTLWSYYPMTPIKFINAGSADSIHYIRVVSTGDIKNYDRKVKMIVEQDSTTAVEGVNYEKLDDEYTIKAGIHFVDIPIKLMKNENIYKEAKRLSFKLIPTNDFTLSIPVWNSHAHGLWPNDANHLFDNTRHYLELTNFLIRPAVWSGLPQADAAVGTQEAGRFGQFTVKKFELMVEVMTSIGKPISYADFSTAATMPNPFQGVINEVMSDYLIKQFDAGKPVLEEDGRLMFFMSCPWKSKIGVPYVPEQ